jgi:dTDP-4-amino-4,6-dideoxygalactose transaminase
MDKHKYNPWPLGHIPQNQQRPELNQLLEKGYTFSDPRDVVEIFEEKVAAFAGSRYAVAVDCCSHGIFLCLKFLKASGVVTVPCQTYVSVPMQVLHSGCSINFEERKWIGKYRLDPYPIWDSAVRWNRGMFEGEFEVLSFQIKKRIPIGRGGMVLTDDLEAYNWLKRASYDFRDLTTPYPDNSFDSLGWHYYMTPEDAARGILLMDQTPESNKDIASWENYPDLSKHSVFNAR